ncbi:dynein 1 light intermediate chain [Lactarius tabidus]
MFKLREVSLSFLRTIPSNIFLVRGQSSTGKSTLASALLQKPLANAEKDVPCTDFVGGCDWADGRDEEEEDTVARLSTYTVPSSFPAAAISHTAVVIVLDWTQPCTFLEDLHTWLAWIERWVKAMAGEACEGSGSIRKEHRECCICTFDIYAEPFAEPLLAKFSALRGTMLPLGPGTFTHNIISVPTIVARTKADLIDEHTNLIGAGVSGVRGINADGIGQILRTICLKYSTSLFYMTPQPATLNFLRQYALHVLFIPPAPSADGTLDSTAAPVHNPFPFVHKLSTLDRDRIISGENSSFYTKAWGEAWEHDLLSEPESSRTTMTARENVCVPPAGPRPQTDPVPTSQQPDARKSLPRKRADRDPRSIFRTPTDASAAPAAGLVRPLCSSSFSLPTVERALAEAGGSSLDCIYGIKPRSRSPHSALPRLTTTSPCMHPKGVNGQKHHE